MVFTKCTTLEYKKMSLLSVFGVLVAIMDGAISNGYNRCYDTGSNEIYREHRKENEFALKTIYLLFCIPVHLQGRWGQGTVLNGHRFFFENTRK